MVEHGFAIWDVPETETWSTGGRNEDVFGRHVAAAADTLPPDVVAAAQERGRAQDPHTAAVELLAKLG